MTDHAMFPGHFIIPEHLFNELRKRDQAVMFRAGDWVSVQGRAAVAVTAPMVRVIFGNGDVQWVLSGRVEAGSPIDPGVTSEQFAAARKAIGA